MKHQHGDSLDLCNPRNRVISPIYCSSTLILHLLTCQGMGHRWWHERIIAFFTRTSHDDSPIEAFFMVSNYKHLKAGELNTYKTDVPGHAICIYVYTHVHTIQTHTIYYTYTIHILYVYITGAIHTLYVDIRRYTLIYTGIHYPSIHPSMIPPSKRLISAARSSIPARLGACSRFG